MKYLGKILAIGPKTIKVDRRGTGEHAKSMDLFDFINRNWDFDLEKITAYNHEESMCI